MLGEIKILPGASTAGGWRCARPGPRVYADDNLIGRLRRSYPAVFSDARPESARQVVLLVIDQRHAAACASSRLPCSGARRTTLPGESSYELRMADHLVAAGRRFVQPLRDDQTDEVVPDFVLGEPNVAVEVWGVKGGELYDLRRKAKLGIYEVRRPTLTLLQWDVTDPLPDVEMHRPPPQ